MFKAFKTKNIIFAFRRAVPLDQIGFWPELGMIILNNKGDKISKCRSAWH